MTYNQVATEITTVLESHAMINTVLFSLPVEWINAGEVPEFPVACFDIGTGSLNAGREQVYRIDMWFLDQSGKEGEFEQEVISDMHGVAYDILSVLRKGSNNYTISSSVQWQAVSEEFEDYLSGVRLSLDFTIVRGYGACDIPTI